MFIVTPAKDSAISLEDSYFELEYDVKHKAGKTPYLVINQIK